MNSVEEIKLKVDTLSDEIDKAVKAAYQKGYDDGLSVSKPTQAQFNKDHREVSAYGDEGQYLVLSGGISFNTARRRFITFMRKNGYDYEPENIDDMISMRMCTYKSTDDHEPDYYLSYDTGIYDCWVLTFDW